MENRAIREHTRECQEQDGLDFCACPETVRLVRTHGDKVHLGVAVRHEQFPVVPKCRRRQALNGSYFTHFLEVSDGTMEQVTCERCR